MNKYKEIKDTCDKHTEKTMGVTVTNVVGKTEAQARTALAGLTIKVVYDSDTTKANGVVLAQDQKAETKLVKGDTITLTVNKIETVTPPPADTNTVTPPTGGNTTTGGNTSGGTNETTGGNTTPGGTNTGTGGNAGAGSGTGTGANGGTGSGTGATGGNSGTATSTT